jgi:hypothetical protein
MNKIELEQFLEPDNFVPFVITMVDGFVIPINKLNKIVTGDQLCVAALDGSLVHIPYGRIAHITHRGELG